MVSRAINDKFDLWYKELNFPRPKDSKNYENPLVTIRQIYR